MRGLVLLLFVLLPVSLQAQVVGYEYTDNNTSPCDYNQLWACAPESPVAIWKAFRSTARQSGAIDHFQVFIVSPAASNVSVGWGIYADNNGQVGALKVGGSGVYNLAVGDNLFPATIVNNNIFQAGQGYWLTFHTSLGEQLQIQRGRTSICANDSKKATNQNSWLTWSPPPGSYFVNLYSNGCYAWAGISDVEEPPIPQPCRCPACGQEVPCTQ